MFIKSTVESHHLKSTCIIIIVKKALLFHLFSFFILLCVIGRLREEGALVEYGSGGGVDVLKPVRAEMAASVPARHDH